MDRTRRNGNTIKVKATSISTKTSCRDVSECRLVLEALSQRGKTTVKTANSRTLEPLGRGSYNTAWVEPGETVESAHTYKGSP